MKLIVNLILLSAVAYVLPAHNTRMTKLEERLLDMLLDSNSSKDKHHTPVKWILRPAFTVSLSASTTLTRKDETVTFDRVILKRGAGYNSRTGIFTAPISGLYQISATIMSTGGSKLHIYIVKNDAYLVDLFGSPLHGSTGTANLVLELKKGDIIMLKHRDNVSEVIFGANYCHFSGFYYSE